MTKKATKYKGLQLKINHGIKIYEDSKGYDIINTLHDSVEGFYKDNWGSTLSTDLQVSDIENLGNVELYKTATCKPDGDINILINFRNKIGKPNFYNKYKTIDEIKEMLNDGYIVAVKGLGEIENIDEIII